jgi:hypothetical protein
MNIDNALKIEGWVEPDELQRIAEWSSNRHKIIEIGSWKGRTTRAICDNTDDLVVTIDHWEGALEPVDDGFWEVDKFGPDYVYNMFQKNLADHIKSSKLSVYKMSSEEAAQLLIEEYGFGYFDMIWIDGGHEYEVVRKDMVYFRPLLRRYGQMCGHDYYYPGVKKALDEVFVNYWQEGNLWSKEV